MNNKYDVIIVGGGHNGLVAGCYLQKSGLRCLVLERSDIVGGAAVSRSLHPDFTYTNCSYVNSLFRPNIMRGLQLHKFGLQIIPFEASVGMLQNGDHFAMYFNDHYAQMREIKRHSPIDCSAYDEFSNAVVRQCRYIKPLLERTPPDPVRLAPRDINELLYIYKRFHNLGARELAETYRFYTMSVADYVNEFFEFEPLKAFYSAFGVVGTGMGAFSPGTAYVLLHHFMGDLDGTIAAWGFTRGGMGGITKALRACFESLGGQVLVNSEVETILTQFGAVKGVATINGDEYYSPLVVSGMDIRRTMVKHVKANDLPDDYLKQVKQFKFRGSSGKLNIALSGEPTFHNIPPRAKILRGSIYTVESLQYIERAFQDWKYGNWSQEPVVELLLPNYIDPTMAPPGQFVATVFVQYCPYQLSGGREWNTQTKQEFANAVLQRISKVSPDFCEKILHCEIRTPQDIEREVGITEGNIFQGELTLDQLLFNRPVPGYADYRTPIKGLYVAGSSTHPGGGVMGAPGLNAAREILLSLGRGLP